MPFFEDLGRKLTSMGQGVAQQTKNIADTTRLNGAVSERERRINQLFQAVGQGYYQRHLHDPDAEERDKLEEVARLYGEIEQYQREINQIKGMATCPACGASVPAQAAFCNVCGGKMPAPVVNVPPPPQAPMQAAPGQPPMQAAPEQVPMQAAPGQMPMQPPMQAAPAPNVRICPACGAQMGFDNRFCTLCGTDMDAPPVAPQQAQPENPEQL